MTRQMILNAIKVAVVLAGLSAMSACKVISESEVSAQTQMHECGRIADRGERERCIEAAYAQ